MKKTNTTLLLLLVTLTSFSQLVTNGLVSNYSFTQGNLTDSISGNTLVGNIPYPTEDRFGNDSCAFYFSGGNTAFLDAGDSYDSLLSGDSAQFSMSFWLWMQNDATNTPHIIFGKRADNNCNQDQRQFYIGVGPTNHIRTVIAGSLTTSSYLFEEDTMTTLVDSTWYHILYTYDFQLNERKIYINCAKDSFIVVTSSGSGMGNGMIPSAAHFGIGSLLSTSGSFCGSPSSSFLGKIDDIRFYNRVLTQTERDSLCNEPNTTGIESYSLSNQIKVYPNPSIGKFNFVLSNIPKKKTTLTITNLTGQKLHEMNLTTKETEYNLDEPNGIYLLSLSTESGIYTTKIIVQR